MDVLRSAMPRGLKKGGAPAPAAARMGPGGSVLGETCQSQEGKHCVTPGSEVLRVTESRHRK